jgi:tRNA pseudouridine55 synthase
MLNGFLNLNKQKSMTSQKAVYEVKRILRIEKVDFEKIGHLGTLDPDGEGVLPIAIGRATRLFNYLLDKRKVYYAEFVFGISTDTLDASGLVIEKHDTLVSLSDINRVVPGLVGQIDQMPPSYSAKSINGVKAYTLARQGIMPSLLTKSITIYSIKPIEQLAHNTFSFIIECGGGTYIRSIARDMAFSLGTVGHMRYIKRISSGNFSIENSLTLSEMSNKPISNFILPIDYAIVDFSRYTAPEEARKELTNGIRLKLPDMPSGDFALYIGKQLFGIATDSGSGIVIKSRLV